MRGQTMFVRDVEVELHSAVVAISSRGDRAEKVVDRRRQAADQTPGPESGRSNQSGGKRALRHGKGGQQTLGLVDPGVRRFRGQAGQADDVLLLLEGEEVEGLVPLDRSANAAAVVQVAQLRRVRLRRRRCEER